LRSAHLPGSRIESDLANVSESLSSDSWGHCAIAWSMTRISFAGGPDRGEGPLLPASAISRAASSGRSRRCHLHALNCMLTSPAGSATVPPPEAPGEVPLSSMRLALSSERHWSVLGSQEVIRTTLEPAGLMAPETGEEERGVCVCVCLFVCERAGDRWAVKERAAMVRVTESGSTIPVFHPLVHASIRQFELRTEFRPRVSHRGPRW
jgi:hypothetical protein